MNHDVLRPHSFAWGCGLFYSSPQIDSPAVTILPRGYSTRGGRAELRIGRAWSFGTVRRK